MNQYDNINQLTAHLFRENSGKMAAVLSRMFGLSAIDTVLDVIQDTFETALIKWRFSGIPDNPSAWLMRVAKNKALNTFKRQNKIQLFSPSACPSEFDEHFENEFNLLISPKEIKDSQLRLLFSCCHPDFSTKNQIIVTLHILCGFGVPEIANALLMNEEAVKKALSRSKDSLKELDRVLQSGIVNQSDERIKTVHTILYLIFNEGYKTTRGKEAINHDLCYEAIRLAKLLEKKEGEIAAKTNALLALMFFNIARFPARLNTSEECLTLEEQDRKQWNYVFIEEAFHYLNKATQSKILSHFHIEAIISSLHCSAPTFNETNWEKIAYLYRQLELIKTSPLVTLNRIIAESYLMDTNSIKALDELELNSDLKNNFLLHVAKGDIYKRKGELENAQIFYEQALSLSTSPVDKRFLKKKIIQCQSNTN